jgi:hypothetical protein
MLHEFLTINRAELIDRCRLEVARRLAPKATPAELEHGIPLFLDQLIETLQVEQISAPMRSLKVSGPSGGGPGVSEIGTTATLHGRELLQQGFTVDQVVHDYGDLCQSLRIWRASGIRRLRYMNFELSTAAWTMESPMPSRNIVVGGNP